jgi:hypothetical protein
MIDINLLIYMLGIRLRTLIRFLDRYKKQFVFVVYEMGKAAYTGAFVSSVLDGVSHRVVILLFLGIILSLTAVKFRE